ncbi:MAG: ATP-dependent DNA helicase RecG, partial [Lachnospiraceae bacterium]|nr:ATP-dependent DNA helicase RecG [Lachnospiraceae bacterium]
MTAEISVKELKGVGDKNASLLSKLGIFTVRDLLEYYPRAYDIFCLPENIAELREGSVAAIESIVPMRPAVLRTPRYLIVSMNASDPTGNIKLVWYNAPFIASQLKVGMQFIFRG